ncbi:MAG: chlororespiratory reduction protein 7 [Cyanobacteria bacterium]|nr:chlororespiratory reduction protein 7 [Cyanobacteriota bacterium]MDW8200803.1 chlororespiratory reduction protein 7 [Cyanobacteriota bacterium SKYGB_h_bin112]
MASSLLYDEDYFVVLEPNQAEQIVTAAELLAKLTSLLTNGIGDLPSDVQRFATVDEQAKYLLATSCELPLAPGQVLQWYAVRLEK